MPPLIPQLTLALALGVVLSAGCAADDTSDASVPSERGPTSAPDRPPPADSGDSASELSDPGTVEGIEWVLVEAGDPVPPEALQATLRLDAGEGTLSGWTGCNRYGAPYRLGAPEPDGSRRLSVTDAVIATEAGCSEPELSVQSAIFSAFDSTVRLRASADSLRIVGDDQTALLTFTRAPGEGRDG